MKKLVLGLMLLGGSMCFAGGKLSVQPSFYPRLEKVLPTVGFGIYEHLGIGGVALNLWTGVGWAPQNSGENVFWATSKAELEKWFGPLGVAVGGTYRHAEKNALDLAADHDVHAKLTYKLW